MAAGAAGIALVAFVLARGPAHPSIDGTSGDIEVTSPWGGSALDGLMPGGLRAGAMISARRTASVRVGPPVASEIVLGPGSRIRLSGPEGGRSVELVEGLAWFDPAPPDGTSADPALRSSLRVRAGGLEVEGRGARFTVERRASGAAVVCIEAGVAVLRSGGGEATSSGPVRMDIPAGGKPGEPLAVESSDATGWFSRPEVLLERGEGGTELLVTLRPEVPAPLRIAPFDRFDPLFTLQAERPGKPPVTIPLRPEMFLRPPPPGDRDGSFTISGARSYRISVDAGSLGLEPGPYSLSAVYASHRVGGLWRGIRSSKPLAYEVK